MNVRNARKLFVSVCTVGFLLLVIGCGPSAVGTTVYGKVTHDGAPLADGMIFFLPQDGTAVAQSSAAITDGEYKLPPEFGLAPGTYEVRIEGYRVATNAPTTLGSGPGALDVPPETPGIPTKEQYLPKKFNTETSLEKLVIEGQGSLEKNFDLKN
ncbi:MAG: carboxypeptidase-like regulatory domain-containing protein [Pirellulaceae bacterium]